MSSPRERRRVQYEKLTPSAAESTAARAGLLRTPHGTLETPVFMPVGTQGTVKGLMPRDLQALGAQIILGNTYHLWLRPGAEVLRSQGGLRSWMAWPGPLLTDSGGFQVFSLADIRTIQEEGVHFQSHLDGTRLLMTPEVSIDMQEAIASTIMMVLDVCPALPATREALQEAMDRSTRWAERCLRARKPDTGALFAIVQGGLETDLRRQHIETLAALQVEDVQGQRHEFDGLALGGFSVGESPEEMDPIIRAITPHLPEDRPRYLMGIGRPQDLLNGIAAGIDMFDCVMPTRNARNGTLFTQHGAVHIKNARFQKDTRPLEEDCPCYTCQNFSRSYLRHLHQSHEILASVLSSLHNLSFYIRLMSQARQAILEGRFENFRRDRLERMNAGAPELA